MSGWRDALRAELARCERETASSTVTLSDLYRRSLPRLRIQFPDNDNPEAKIRQQLQELEKRGEVEFVDNEGTYRIVSLALDDIAEDDLPPPSDTAAGRERAREAVVRTSELRGDAPERVTRVVDELRRDGTLVSELKALYDHRCQLCGRRRLQGTDRGYSEAHHLRPLGDPHGGPDVPGNIVVVCPNHHADFDHGMVTIDPDTRAITHAYDESANDALTVADAHAVGTEFLRYHARRISAL